MARNKTSKFDQNKECEIIIEPGKALYDKIKGNWDELFENDNPIVVELGCGRGEYSNGLAGQFPDKNFVGVDIKGARLWKGSQVAMENGYKNVAFMRCQILTIANFFEENEIDEIWITFPDPRPRDRDIKRRLTSPRFLDIYRPLLKEGGIVHLKTDNDGLFAYTLEILEEQNIKPLALTHDLYNSELLPEMYGVQTHYEKLFLAEGENINYVRFKIH